ncbi:MAG: GtrA family protein [Pseudomonadota bacterium]|nr:GtrA family protein [Pseudomonadota bacterium]
MPAHGRRGDHIALRFLRFGLIGGTTGILYAAVAYLLISAAGVVPWLASALAYGAVLPVNYFGQRLFAFRSSGRHRIEAPRFVLVHLCSLAGNALILQGCVSILHLDVPLAVGISTVATPVVAFAFLNFWVFLGRAGHGKDNSKAGHQ